MYKSQAAKKLLGQGRKTLLMFHAHWCGNCSETIPQLHKASMHLCGVGIYLVDEEVHGDFATELNIQALPTLVLFDPAGKEMKRVEGFQDAETIIQFAS